MHEIAELIINTGFTKLAEQTGTAATGVNINNLSTLGGAGLGGLYGALRSGGGSPRARLARAALMGLAGGAVGKGFGPGQDIGSGFTNIEALLSRGVGMGMPADSTIGPLTQQAQRVKDFASSLGNLDWSALKAANP